MHTLPRILVAGLAAGALAVGVSACGSDSSSTSTSTPAAVAPAAGETGTSASSGANPAAAAAGVTEKIGPATLAGTKTSVTLDPATAAVLKKNGVSVAPVAPATAAMDNGDTVVSFPIKKGEVTLDPSADPFVTGSVDHTGGLTFSAGAKKLTATNFTVDPGESMLTATVGGARVPIFFLDGSKLKVSAEGGDVILQGTEVKLTEAAAQALNQTFGTDVVKEFITVGTARIQATPAG